MVVLNATLNIGVRAGDVFTEACNSQKTGGTEYVRCLGQSNLSSTTMALGGA